MRICIVSREYPPVTQYTGGIGVQYAALAPALARLGHDVHVITLTWGGEERFVRDGVAVHTVRPPIPAALRARPRLLPLWFFGDPLYARLVDRELRAIEGLDVVFAAEWGGEAWRYVQRPGAAPVVTDLQTSLAQMLEISPAMRLRVPLQTLVQNHVERRQTERSAAVVARSHAILDWARRLWDIERIPTALVPNMVDVAAIRSLREGNPPDGFPDDDGPVVAFAGRLEMRKGVHVLIEAMRAVWDERPDAHLVLMGHDNVWQRRPMSEHLRDVAGEHAARLHLLGNQPRERLFPALARADVVTLPSLWENFALAGLEIMALGCPLVVTSGSGFDDMVSPGRHALMAPPGDAAALAAALERMLADAELRRRLGDAAAQRAAAEFDIDPVTRRHAEVLDAVVAGRPLPAGPATRVSATTG